MDFAAYAEAGIALVNAPMGDLAALRRHLRHRPGYGERAGERDLVTLRALQRRLREVVEAADAGDEQGAIARLNALLQRTAVSPRISGHDAHSWHLHVTAPGTAIGNDIAAEVLMGLAVAVIDRGADRLGLCRAEGCELAYLDTSPNRSRRYCSQRCASRSNVAAFRARARARAGAQA